MAARTAKFIAVRDADKHILAIYLAKTPGQALREHAKPLDAVVLLNTEAAKLMAAGMIAIEVLDD